MTEQKTLADFIKSNGLVMLSATQVPANPHMTDFSGKHYLCEIENRKADREAGFEGRRTMKVYFSMGDALKGRPKITDVLDCLASDATSADQSFEDWCADYGYNSDSRKALKTYETIREQSRNLRGLIGSTEAYEELLYNVERL